jgi:hypothetical protein
MRQRQLLHRRVLHCFSVSHQLARLSGALSSAAVGVVTWGLWHSQLAGLAAGGWWLVAGGGLLHWSRAVDAAPVCCSPERETDEGERPALFCSTCRPQQAPHVSGPVHSMVTKRAHASP